MPKRFTDTEKWKKSFMRNMKTPYKLLWLYILDECDHAGIWHVDFEVAQIKTGEKIKKEVALSLFKDKVIEFDDATKWFIPDFIAFQYGELRDNNKAHTSVIRALERYGFMEYVQSGFTTPLNNNIKGIKRDNLYIRDNYVCTYCAGTFIKEELEPDHVVPLNLGGTNDLLNVVTACKGCNRKKSDMPLDVFIEKFSLDKEGIYKRINTSRGLQAPSNGAMDMDMVKDKEMDKDMDKESKPEIEKMPAIEYPFGSDFLEVWGHWKKYKKDEHKFSYKSIQSEQASLNELATLSKGVEATAAAIIHQSMAKGWKGFFELKNETNGNTGNTNYTGRKPSRHEAGITSALADYRKIIDARGI